MARTEVVLPSLGESVTEALITAWLKQPGDKVAEDEPLLEVSTDKIDSEIPAPVAGVLVEVVAGEGSDVPVGTVVAYIETDAEAADAPGAIGGVVEQAAASAGIDDDDGQRILPTPDEPVEQITAPISIDVVGATESVDATSRTLSPSDAMSADEDDTKFAPEDTPSDMSGEPPSEAATSLPDAPTSPDAPVSSGDPVSGSGASDGDDAAVSYTPGLVTSPVVRKLLRQYGLDPGSIVGTGVGGRITRRDVLAVVDTDQRTETQPESRSQMNAADLEIVDPPYGDVSADTAQVPPRGGDVPVDGASADGDSADGDSGGAPHSDRVGELDAEGMTIVETGISGPEGPIPGSEHASDALTFEPTTSTATSAANAQQGPDNSDGSRGKGVGESRDGAAESSAKFGDTTSTTSSAVALRMPTVTELLSQPSTSSRPTPRPRPLTFTDGVAHIPLTGMRGAVARNMEQSFRSIPHVSQSVDIDYEQIDRIRDRIKQSWKAEEGFSLSYLPFIARAVCMSIAEYPLVNAHLDGDSLIVPRYVNLGIAVDLDFEGLIVPVIRDAHTQRVPQLARAISDIARRARSKQLTPDNIQGGTYTLSNNGSFGTRSTAAIIAPGQTAVLSVDGIEPRPAVVDGAIGIRKTGMLVQSFDHRALDGSYSAMFLTRLKDVLEHHDWAQEFTAGS
ncbi:MAG: 2-oxo acid dehydrogenase subunit E2 [Actinobacteria bacterium]|nr:2-oxo acid dehydrogenase subunit E2 [Actinomycetota bacterium]